jgi:cytochrome P450
MRKISPVIEAEVARAGQGNDMVDVLKRAHGDDKQRMFEELLGNLIGGSETTIIFMTWLLHFLAHDLELQERLRKEVMGFDPTRDKVGDLHLLNDCIIECLRLRSPAFMTSRTAARDTRLGDIAIPAGTHVFGSQYITQLHPAVWKDPERFDPDRLRTRRPSNNKEQSDWFPFGGGKNVCAGQKYVFAEAGLGVARLLQHFRITPVSPLDVGMDPQLTMRPGIPVVVRATAIPSS